MKVVVGFSKPIKFNLISTLLMWIEKTDFSHAFIEIYSDSLDRSLIYQANHSGVFFHNTATFLKSNRVMHQYELTVTKQQSSTMLRWAIDNLGKPYGVWQLLGIAVKRLFKKNPWADGNKSFVCTELVLMALNELGLIKQGDADNIGLLELKRIVAEASA